MVKVFAVGRRVKVVAPDPYDETMDATVGEYGAIVAKSNDPMYEWEVELDGYGYSLYFIEKELELIDAGEIEGVLYAGNDNPYISIDHKSLWDELHPHSGKRIRVTWEVIDDER